MTEWINILRCPVSHEDLRLMRPDEMAAFNNNYRDLSIGDVEEALVNKSGRYAYPFIDGIPVLLSVAAFDMQSSRQNTSELSSDKKKVLDFYNSQGWVTADTGDYADAVIYEDLRPVSAGYILKCHQRLARHLPLKGKYLLDAASGAIQFDIYLSYSEHFERRVCVDFSLLALKEARKKLGEKGIYILCDIANMPFRDESMDAFISLNTIYHIPFDEQVKAVDELYRLLPPGSKGVLVYDWFKHSAWMNITLLPFRAFVYLKNRVSDGIKKLSGNKPSGGRLYFHAHTPGFMKRNLPPYRLYVWRTVSVPFLKYYIHSRFFGRRFLKWLYNFEEKHPEMCGKYGEYPMMVFEKR